MEQSKKNRRGRRPTVAVAVVLVSACALIAFATTSAASPGQPSLNVGPAGGIVFAHGQGKGKPGGGSNPDMTYHSGPVLTGGAAVTAIFWGTSWNSLTDSGGKISGIGSFYKGVGGSSYAGTNTEYTDSSSHHVGSSVSYGGYIIDNSAAPSNAPSTSTILAEVTKIIGANGYQPPANGYYPVYVDTPRGHARYCAWHSYGTVNGVVVQFAFFFNLDNDSGCNPNSPTSQSEGLQALGNVSGHELSETLTDPKLNAWYDGSGAENADKCAWTFGSQLLNLGGTSWKIQGNWSNNAYDTSKGYVSSGTFVRGCIDGTN